MLKEIILAAGFILAAHSAMADSFWEHNGSIMRLKTDGADGRTLVYEQPSATMRKAGVRKGTVLFEGYRRADEYFGTARVFYSKCGVVKYRVMGDVPEERVIILHGERQQLNAQCRPTGEKAYDVLEFVYVRSE